MGERRRRRRDYGGTSLRAAPGKFRGIFTTDGYHEPTEEEMELLAMDPEDQDRYRMGEEGDDDDYDYEYYGRKNSHIFKPSNDHYNK